MFVHFLAFFLNITSRLFIRTHTCILLTWFYTLNLFLHLREEEKPVEKQLFEKVWPANLALFIYWLYWPNRATSLDTFCCLRDIEVKPQIVVRELPGTIPGSGKHFYVFFFCPKHIICPTILQLFGHVNLLRILNIHILQNVDRL